MKFSPASIQVRVGDRIEFKNIDFVPHTATSTKGQPFDSGTLQTGESWTVTCHEVGVTDYRCHLHPTMTASIEVVARL
jgi:plastocyanin